MDDTNDTDKPKLKLRQLNELAYDDLILSMDTSTASGEVAFNLSRSAKTSDYRNGDATLAYKKLKTKYSPDTAPTLTKLHKIFYSSKLKKNADPDVLITNLEDVRV